MCNAAVSINFFFNINNVGPITQPWGIIQITENNKTQILNG